MDREKIINVTTKGINTIADLMNTAMDFTKEKYDAVKEKASSKEVNFSNATQIQKEFIMMLAENLQDIDDATIMQCRDIVTHQLDLKHAIIKINDDQITVENVVAEEVNKL